MVDFNVCSRYSRWRMAMKIPVIVVFLAVSAVSIGAAVIPVGSAEACNPKYQTC